MTRRQPRAQTARSVTANDALGDLMRHVHRRRAPRPTRLFEHRVLLAEVAAVREPHPADELRAEIGEDIAEQAPRDLCGFV
jgi:hypothetical protein